MDVLRKRLRYIVPFETTDLCYDAACKAINSYKDNPYNLFDGHQSLNGSWVQTSLKTDDTEQDLYDYIINEFSCSEGEYNNPNGLGNFWKYENSSDKNAPILNLKFYREKKTKKGIEHSGPYDIQITEMGLYLFRNRLGFLWYEIAFPETENNKTFTERELITFQNLFKEINRGRFPLLWVDRSLLCISDEYNCNWKLQREELKSGYFPILLGDWVAKRLDFLNVKYLAPRKNEYGNLIKNMYGKEIHRTELVPDKAVLFSYVVFNRVHGWSMDDYDYSVVYHLTNGYKDSYEVDVSAIKQIGIPFSNVCWLATKEGAGYYAWTEENSSNYIFFTQTRYDRIMGDYFLLYIKALFQSYSLLKYSMDIADKLSPDIDDYMDSSDKAITVQEKITSIRTEISLFLAKGTVTSVSHIQHQNDFFEHCLKQLRIDDDIRSVTAGLAALDELQKKSLIANEQEKDQQMKNAENRIQLSLAAVAFLACVSTFTDIMAAKGELGDLISYILLAIYFVIMLFSVGVILPNLFSRRKKKKNKKA